MEAAPRVELGITGLQSVALATWPCRLNNQVQYDNQHQYVETKHPCQHT
jgi:hypothetical protein